MADLHPTNAERQAFMSAVHARVGNHTADGKTTVVDYLRADLGWDPALFDAALEILVKGGLITPPTRTGAIGLTSLGLTVARRRSMEGREVEEEDEDD